MHGIHRRLVALAGMVTFFGLATGAADAVVAVGTTTSSATATFGRTTGGTMRALAADQKRVSRFALREHGSATHISAYLDGNGSKQGSSQSVRYVVYADNGGNPGSLLGVTDSYAIAKRAAGRWVTLGLRKPLTLTPGTYFLGIHSGGHSGLGRFAAVDASGALKQNRNLFTAGASDPFGSATTSNLEASIYATYTPITPPSNMTPPSIAGEAAQGATLTASEGAWTGSPTSYAYQWRRCDSAGAICLDVVGATTDTLVLTSADVGATLRVAVTARNVAGSTTAVSAPTAVVRGPANADACAGQFRSEFFNNRTMSGTPVVTRCDASVDWNWGSGSPGSGVNADDFSARLVGQFDLATSGTYTFSVTADDGVRLYVDGALVIDRWLVQAATTYTAERELAAGRHEIRVEYYEATGLAVLRYSVAGPTPPVNTALPMISGSAVVGQTLTASTGSWTGSPTSYAYQWRRCDSAGANCANVVGATAQTYAVASADVGSTLRVAVTATNSSGSSSATSAQTPVASEPTGGECAVGQFRTEFFNNTTVTGTPVLARCDASVNWNWGSGSPGSGVNADNFSARLVGKFDSATSGTYTFSVTADDGVRLYVDGALVIDRWIVQAETTYTAERELAAGRHEIRVEYYEATGLAVLRYSVSAPVAPAPPVNSSPPVISGSAQVGRTLTASPGTWSGSPTPTYAYQWLRCNSSGASCASISGATSAGYVVASADLDRTLRVKVIATNSSGSAEATSAATAVVTQQTLLNGLLGTDLDYFPIAVWMQQPQFYAADYKALGINIFHGLWDPPGTTNERVQALEKHDLTAIVQGHQMAQALATTHPQRVVAWHQIDEPDNAQWTGSGWGDCIDPQVIIDKYNEWKAADPTRPIVLNFGFGAAFTTWWGRGSKCAGRTDMYPEYQKGADIVSFDIYPVNEGWPITYVADGVDNLIRWTNGEKPVWAFIETTRYQETNGTPSPAQTRAQVWLALTHGADAIQYFVHVFTPSFIEAGVLQDAAMKAELTRTNGQIARLARVLNSPTVANGASVSAPGRIDWTVKRLNGETYLFAVNPNATTLDAEFTVAGLSGGSVAAIDENRSLTLANGRFGDRFGAYGVHLYRITPVG